MKIEECIKTRKSVRKYSDKDVSVDTLKEVIELARHSPSWKNTQITRYHIIKNEEVKANIANVAVSEFKANVAKILNANVLVVVTYERNLSGYNPDGSLATSKGNDWEMFDAGIACQTFSLAAHYKGLGSVILGLFDEEKVYECIDIPKTEKVAALITVGYPEADDKRVPPAKKEVEELATFVL